MHKKKFFKTTAIVVCFALVVLAFPGLTSAKTKAPRFDLSRFLKKPAMFVASLLSYLPIYDTGRYVDDYDVTPDVKYGKKVKVTGDLSKGRPSGGD